MTGRTPFVAGAVLLAVAVSACSSPSEPRRSIEDLGFLRLTQNAPPLANTEVTFWAVRGENREARIYFVGQDADDEFLRFRVRNESLLRLPGGDLIAEGDSVEITIRIINMERLIFEFEPSGLVFNPAEPAELKLDFEEAEDDLNEDGTVDDDDLELRASLSWWRQEASGLPWIRQASLVFDDVDEIEADVFGFTNYAVAY